MPSFPTRRPTWLAALLLAVLSGCVATPPHLRRAAAEGVVRAESVEQATVTAALLDDLVPRVRALLPDTRLSPVEVWVQPHLRVYDGWSVDEEVPAFTLEEERRIHVLEGEPAELSAALAHELVHSLLGTSWRTLPPVAEEGLADWVQEQLHPGLAPALRADHLAKAAAALGGMSFGLWSSWPRWGGSRMATFRFFGPGPEAGPSLDVRAAIGQEKDQQAASFWRPYEVSVSDPRLYGVGYLVVAGVIDQIGVEGLHALCVRAATEGRRRVPGAWLLQHARLTGDDGAWRAAIAARMGPAELLALAASLADDLVDLVAQGLRPATRAPSGDAFLKAYRPRLGLLDGTVRVPLSAVPGLADRLRVTWPGRRDGLTREAEQALPWRRSLSSGASP